MMGGKVLEAVEFGEHEDARTANRADVGGGQICCWLAHPELASLSSCQCSECSIKATLPRMEFLEDGPR